MDKTPMESKIPEGVLFFLYFSFRFFLTLKKSMVY